MALVFTAISNSVTALLLWSALGAEETSQWMQRLNWPGLAATAVVSIGLYGFGMSLNDIIDRRRDRLLASERPLPSGRIGLATAHFVCGLLFIAAILGGLVLGQYIPIGDFAFVLIIWTAMLIAFYNLVGKYLVAPGLISLGLIRFFHACIPAPDLPLVWHPLLLLNHVAILSAIAYAWERKRPAMTHGHFKLVVGGLLIINLVALGLPAWRRADGFSIDHLIQAMNVTPALLLPLGAVIVFIVLGLLVYRRVGTDRRGGQKLMLYGLLWLIVYDAAFVVGHVGWLPALGVLLLLPVAYLSVRAMRWWSNLLSLTQKPEYQRVR